MANTASRWLDACTALTFGMRARAGYRSPVDASAAIPVYHSIEIGMHSAGNVRQYLVIRLSNGTQATVMVNVPDVPELQAAAPLFMQTFASLRVG